MEKITHKFMYGNQEVTFETGEIARQAAGAVMVSMDNTRVLVAVTANKKVNSTLDFFPLTVNYQEKFYSTGRIPGGFLKREGRLTELETLTSRLIDRPIRPLFPKQFTNEVQVTATVMAQDKEYTAEVAAMLGTSAALTISGVPFNGPIGAAQVGYMDGEFALNPTIDYLNTSELILSIAGTDKAVLMVESEADELSEQQMLDAVKFGHSHMQVAIQAIKDFEAMVGNPKWDWEPPATDESLRQKVKDIAEQDLSSAYSLADKTARVEAIAQVTEKLMEQLAITETNADNLYAESEINGELKNLQKAIVRGRLLNGEPRIDGRDTTTVRPIHVKCGVLPTVHGSALFTRGETQALVVTTLGTERDSKMIDDAAGFYKDNFMLHYNFPSYSVGECGRNMGPGRREIGHGMLARRGISSILPRVEDFPYTIRIVSEITESNGSSSMASICGSSLSLMDAGVPTSAPVAGIAMGLIKDDEKFAILSDILGDEDHLGDMDFKVAGTEAGITTMQMDIKIEGITEEIMSKALDQAKTGRLHILGIMNQELGVARSQLADTAPRYLVTHVKPEKIGAIIGKGGAVIKKLQEDYQCIVEVKDNGEVKVSTVSQEMADACIAEIEMIVADVEIGKIYDGKVMRIVDFGAFVNLLPGKDGLLHISQIRDERVAKVSDELKVGEVIKVKAVKVDNQGKVSLTAKGI